MFSDKSDKSVTSGRSIATVLLLSVGLCAIVASSATSRAQPAAQPPAQPAAQPAAQQSPLLSEPTTADALFDAVVLMVDLARPELARIYMQNLLALNPDDAALLAMRDKHGPAVFLRMANLEYLQPGSVTLLERMNASFARFAGDTARIDRLISELGGPPSVRDAAILQLRSGGALVVPRLVEQIGDVQDEATRELLSYSLTRLGPDVVPPLLAVLESPEANLRTTALEVLGHVGSRKTAVQLWYFAVDANQPPGVRVAAAEAVARLTLGASGRASDLSRNMALRALEQGARVRLAGGERAVAGADGKVTAWHFNTTENRLVGAPADPDDVALHLSIRLAQQALALSPENRRLQALVVSVLLTRSRTQTPWTRSLPRGAGTAYDTALLAGREVVSESLRDALQSGNATAAVAALEVMRSLATRHDLQSRGGTSAPLTGALNYPDLRVQFAAAMVIVETDPPKPFRGSSRIVEVLARALESTDTPRAVLAGPKPDQVNALAGLVGQSGYEAEIASSGRNAFRSAAGRGDVQLVVLDANVIQWSLSETVANLRADSRTAWIPIAVVGNPMRIASVERMISRDPLMVYIQRPANLKGLQDQLGPFISGLGTEPLSAVERGELSRAAVDLLGFLADGRRATVFDLRPAEAGLHAAIQVPELADGAIYAMAAIATTSAQDRLATTALQPDLAEGTRERAAAQLAFHIQKHGVLLAGTRVQQLQQVHAEEASPAVKSSLAAVLGTLGPSAARIGQRLRAVPLPAPR